MGRLRRSNCLRLLSDASFLRRPVKGGHFRPIIKDSKGGGGESVLASSPHRVSEGREGHRRCERGDPWRHPEVVERRSDRDRGRLAPHAAISPLQSPTPHPHPRCNQSRRGAHTCQRTWRRRRVSKSGQLRSERSSPSLLALGPVLPRWGGGGGGDLQPRRSRGLFPRKSLPLRAPEGPDSRPCPPRRQQLPRVPAAAE